MGLQMCSAGLYNIVNTIATIVFFALQNIFIIMGITINVLIKRYWFTLKTVSVMTNVLW